MFYLYALFVQEERVLQYKILNDAHKVYLATGPQYDLVL